ncbi:alkyl/aryl-sulfatase [Photorhabdus africana]|uniref:alkyl/aryl-sulfatase n=1 Tax=Photorhabdus africana TaxID=3097554 RepID=UPI002B4131D1|nr:alkyl sulfatase dimerization domain-containing protein [Photorhabdus sp. CRI-LC]
MNYKCLLTISTAISFAIFSSSSLSQDKFSLPATEITKQVNAEMASTLPFNDKSDFDDAKRGLIARPDSLIIRDDKGKVILDIDSYRKFITDKTPAPDTVNPSLWRNAQLNVEYGLFKVTDHIYQVRGYDIANVTFIAGDTGWIVLDPATSSEAAKAAYDLVSKHLGKKPVVSVIYSHSHVDHYGGVRSIVNEDDVKAGKVQIIAPEGFMEQAASEKVIAGNAMSRRAVYMFGSLLPRTSQGHVGTGLSAESPAGTVTLIPPTRTIKLTGEKMTIDGVEMVFQITSGTEAPAEMNTWFPQWKAMWMAENTTNTMHNILSLRGVQVRDALAWSKYIDQVIELYGDQVEVKFQSHQWPMWGKERVVDYFKKQRDLYKYIHDQTVNLMNKGYIGEEISEMIRLPSELARYFPNRGYHGSLSHNVRAVYQFYMGWYSGNPSDLNNLPPKSSAIKYVEYMGGEAALIKRAQADFDKGEYRWVAQVLKHVVFANPDNVAGKTLLAKTYEQLGYQSESNSWRSIYLQGAAELRHGVPKSGGLNTSSPDMIRAISPEMLFDYLAVRLNGPKAAGKKLVMNINLTDLNKHYTLTVENGVLNYTDKQVTRADVTLTLTKAILDKIHLGEDVFDNEVKKQNVKIEGERAKFNEFIGMLDHFPFWFNIVTPRAEQNTM